MTSLQQRIQTNPFYVLDLSPSCSMAEVERAGQKWLGMLALEMSESQVYLTPWGPMPRTADLVRTAMAALRKPEERWLAEYWLATFESVTFPAPKKEMSFPKKINPFYAMGLASPND